MDLNLSNNSVRLTGTMAAAPTLSHESRGERFFLLPLEVRRLSGAADRLPVSMTRKATGHPNVFLDLRTACVPSSSVSTGANASC